MYPGASGDRGDHGDPGDPGDPGQNLAKKMLGFFEQKGTIRLLVMFVDPLHSLLSQFVGSPIWTKRSGH